MKTAITKFFVLLLAVILFNCSKKEDYTQVKKDLSVLQTNWSQAGENLRTTMSNMKTDLEKYGKAQVSLGKLSKSNNVTLKQEFVKVLTDSKIELDSLKLEMQALNAYAKDWSMKSKELNKLISGINEESIPVAQVEEQILKFREFKALSDPKLVDIQAKIDAYAPKHEKLNSYILKHQKKKVGSSK